MIEFSKDHSSAWMEMMSAYQVFRAKLFDWATDLQLLLCQILNNILHLSFDLHSTHLLGIFLVLACISYT